jgi:hypothetical protein
VTKERQLVRKGGSLIPVEIRARMLPQGNILGIVLDISERKRADEAIARAAGLIGCFAQTFPGLVKFPTNMGATASVNYLLLLAEKIVAATTIQLHHAFLIPQQCLGNRRQTARGQVYPVDPPRHTYIL